jgi:hypothetical protein
MASGVVLPRNTNHLRTTILERGLSKFLDANEVTDEASIIYLVNMLEAESEFVWRSLLPIFGHDNSKRMLIRSLLHDLYFPHVKKVLPDVLADIVFDYLPGTLDVDLPKIDVPTFNFLRHIRGIPMLGYAD